MIQSILIGIALLGSVFNFVSPKQSYLDYDWKNPPLRFGAITYPSSLDVFENPTATQSVATVVTHSTQHSNANDALEAVEAKLGTGASTPISGTVFVGDGTGTSRYSTYATTTNLSTTGIQTTTFLANGSSTLQNFTAVNSTSSSATTTNLFSTTASSSNLFTASVQGAGLSTCTGANFLQWSGGVFGCEATTGATISSVSTTSAQDLATTTIRGIPFGKIMRVSFMLATTSNQSVRMCFNEDWGGCKTTTGYYTSADSLDGAAIGTTNDSTYAFLRMGGAGTQSVLMFGDFTIFNSTTSPKIATGQLYQVGTSSTSSFNITESNFAWGSTTAAINSISIITNVPTLLFGVGSYIQVDVIEN